MSSERKPPDDRELDDFLAGKHPVGRAYREVSEHETAPRELDDAILRMAREHAAPKADAVTPRRRPRWVQPVALAATLALSLSVLINIWREPSLRQQAVPIEQGGEEAMAGSASAPAPAPAPAPSVGALSSSVQPRKPEPVAEPPPAAGAAKALESRRAEPFPRVAAERDSDDALADTVSPSAVAPRGDAAMAPAPPPPPPPATAPAAQASGAAPSRPDMDARVLERLGEDNPRYSKYYSLDENAAVMRPEQKKREAAPAQPMAKQKLEKSMPADAAARAEAESTSKEQGDTRDVLVERARAAVQRGDDAEARRVVAELRRRYPDAPLPEDLRAFDIPPR